MTDRTVRIAYLSASDPHDKKSWSGIHYSMYRSLQQQGFDVDAIGPMSDPFKTFGKVVNRITKVTVGKKYDPEHTIVRSKYYAYLASKKIKEKGPFDLIFAPNASTELAFLETDTPMIYLSGTTFEAMHDYYDSYSNLLGKSLKQNRVIEQNAIRKADRLIYPSQWAADSAIKDYHADPSNIEVIPYGANMEHPPDKSDIHLNRKLEEPIHFLFIGVDWLRKGGDKVYDTLTLLRNRDIDLHFTIVGCTPDIDLSQPWISHYPFLDKHNTEDSAFLERLYQEAHFLFVPSRNECFGVVFSEAAAFGLPSIATDTGGIPTVVKDQLTGALLPTEDNSSLYADQIASMLENQTQYQAMCHAARNEYEKRLNWSSWGVKAGKVVRDLLQLD